MALRCCSVVFRLYSRCISVERRFYIGYTHAWLQPVVEASEVRSGIDRDGVVSIEGQDDENASLDNSSIADCCGLCAGLACLVGFARWLYFDLRREDAQWLAR